MAHSKLLDIISDLASKTTRIEVYGALYTSKVQTRARMSDVNRYQDDVIYSAYSRLD